eukprot:COSAG05_NODE_915_length_6628_cov_1.974269_3_plen_77_part_00
MPKKPVKTVFKRFDRDSVEKRRLELELYLQQLIRIPAIGSNPDVLKFLNAPMTSEEAASVPTHTLTVSNPCTARAA